MRIRAEAAGVLLPAGDWRGHVHSAFEHALNLQVEGGNLLLTVLASSDMDLPQGIRISPSADDVLHMSPGGWVKCAGGVLQFRGGLEIELLHARPYSSPVRNLLDLATADSRHATCRQVWNALEMRQVKQDAVIRVRNLTRDEPESILENRIAAGLQLLTEATRENDVGRARKACDALIGLGIGLTPSGDDMLVGFLAGLWATCQNDPLRLAWVEKLGDEIVKRINMTNDISATFLRCAALAQFSSPLSELTVAMCRGGSASQVADAADRLFSFGHSSGLDMSIGLLTALELQD